MTCSMTTTLGAYLLGTISPTERGAVDLHLPTCSTCRDEVVSLASLPGLLCRVAAEDLDDLRPPVPVPAPTAPPVHAGRRRGRRGVIAAVAVGLAGVGLAGVLTLVTIGEPTWPEPAAVFAATDTTSQVQASATLMSRPWGTQVQLQLDGLPAAGECQLVVHADDGRQETGGSWTANSYSSVADIAASTSIPADDISALDVVTAEGQLLVHLVAEPGANQPATEAPAS